MKDVFMIAMCFENHAHKASGLILAEFAKMTGCEEYSLGPARIVEQWLEHAVPLHVPICLPGEERRNILQTSDVRNHSSHSRLGPGHALKKSR